MKTKQLRLLVLMITVIFIKNTETFAQGQFFITGKDIPATKSFALGNQKGLIDTNQTKYKGLVMGLFFKKHLEAYGDSIWKTDASKHILDRAPTHIGIGGNGEPILASELFAGLLGNWRLAFGAAVVGGSDSLTKSAQTFFNGGGNAFLMGTLPLLHYDSNRRNGSRGRYVYAFLFNPKVAGNLPKGDNKSNLTAWATDIGIEGHAELATSNQEIGIIAKFRLASVFGNKDYINTISTHKSFTYIQVSTGLILGKSVLVNINLSPAITNKVVTVPSTIGVQLKL